MNEIKAFGKGSPESPLVSAMGGHNRRQPSIYKPGVGNLPDTKFVGALILDFPAFRTVRNKLVVYSHLVYDVLLQQTEWTKTVEQM